MPGIVNLGLVRNFQLNVQSGVGEVVELWGRVVDQVRCQGLSLGVCLDLPAERVSD